MCFCRLWRKNRRQTPTNAQGKPFSAPHQATLAANAYGCTGKKAISAPNRTTATRQAARTLESRRSGRQSFAVLAAQRHCVQAQNGKRRKSFAKPVSKAHLTQRELQGLRAFRRIEILLQQAKTSRSAHGSHAQLHPRTCATHAERRSTTIKRNGQIARSL